MIIIGTYLLCALLAGCAAWLVRWLLAGRCPDWLVFILSSATLVYIFWLLPQIAPIKLGR